MKTPLCIPNIGKEEEEIVLEVLRSGWLAHGEYNTKLQNQFIDLTGCHAALAMNSCTSALEVSLKVAGIKGKVLVPSFTWVASVNSIITSGATPVFVDVDLDTRNVTRKHLEEAYTPDVEAVMVVHYAGQPCNMTDIVSFCDEKNVLLIEDSAETLGATWEGKQVGSFGLGCFSFFPTKNITTGEGGMLTLPNEEFLDDAKALMAHGIKSTTYDREEVKKPWERSAFLPGHNYRLSNILAALGFVQFNKLEEMNKNRQKLATRYTKALNDLGLPIIPPKVHPKATHVYQMYTILVDEDIRDELVVYLREQEIGASVHFYPAVHQQPYYLGKYKHVSLQNTEELVKRLITLPIYPTMIDEQVDYVIDQIRLFFKQ